ncbi:DUF4381 domain-containing protein [Pinibacter aurantiacus]|uniref:DUF4381 domain-containing protein n=1 Tax=Pinibacter aurantiacus TaxID=2851599 RepID=A0A9E2W9X9_9BACT|nr:DUF4381 domain-containing protein [Pinibacter aurantiacus]MBV4360452.1 DUF4381 domain-containing protein [Pinibacter aurantiacus]
MDETQFGQLIEPAPVKFTYSTPGWYVLGALLLLLLIVVLWLLIRHYIRNSYRREAIKSLQQIETMYAASNNYTDLVYETNMLAKRVAMSRYGRHPVAGLRGEEWINYMNSKWRKKSFNANDASLLANNLYTFSPLPSEQASLFVSKTKDWIRKHRK